MPALAIMSPMPQITATEIAMQTSTNFIVEGLAKLAGYFAATIPTSTNKSGLARRASIQARAGAFPSGNQASQT